MAQIFSLVGQLISWFILRFPPPSWWWWGGKAPMDSKVRQGSTIFKVRWTKFPFFVRILSPIHCQTISASSWWQVWEELTPLEEGLQGHACFATKVFLLLSPDRWSELEHSLPKLAESLFILYKLENAAGGWRIFLHLWAVCLRSFRVFKARFHHCMNEVKVYCWTPPRKWRSSSPGKPGLCRFPPLQSCQGGEKVEPRWSRQGGDGFKTC